MLEFFFWYLWLVVWFGGEVVFVFLLLVVFIVWWVLCEMVGYFVVDVWFVKLGVVIEWICVMGL